ncbi:anion permease [Alkalibacter rhizosphaerae]|uniref:Anion permease n=1 Tax=Alkalibacter rhizosphaerae TaxID=2815577 RepID=A0A975AIE0_9FIRM|nr:SLC13 family permease [Alkalibacter rhizosphaerae]QSX08978.1 anion permease [Alkalibacter rhizosphaerae]
MKKSQIIGLILALAILIGMNFLPASETLSIGGRNTLGILFTVIVLLITEPIPIGVTCLLSIPLLVLFKAVPTIPAALGGFTNPIVFFVLASFGISRALTKVPLSNRLLKVLIKTFGKNVKRVMLAVMITIAVVSSVISNVAATAVFISIVLGFLQIYKREEDRRKTGKTFMIALPVAGMIGGMLTPAGSSLNLMTLSFLEELTGASVTFLEWMVIGVPVVLVVLPFAWFILLKIYPVVEIPEKDIMDYVDTLDVPEKMDAKERYVLLLMTIMFTLWILSSWFPVFNITIVALVGFAFLFIPGFEIITWDEFLASVSWPAFFLVGSVITIGGALISNGVSQWLVANFFPQTLNLPTIGIGFVAGIIVFLMLIIVPVAPALIPLLSAPFVGLAVSIGISPVFLMMVLGLTVANCYLLPLDTVPLLTYMTGYYKMQDMPKVTAFIQLFLAVIVAIWVPIALSILGLM